MPKLFYQPLVVIILTALAIILFVSLIWSSYQLSQSSRQVGKTKLAVGQEQANVDKLKTQLQVAQSETTKETIIRGQLLQQKPGEYVLQMPDLPVVKVTPLPSPASPTPWQEWQQLLFKTNS